MKDMMLKITRRHNYAPYCFHEVTLEGELEQGEDRTQLMERLHDELATLLQLPTRAQEVAAALLNRVDQTWRDAGYAEDDLANYGRDIKQALRFLKEAGPSEEPLVQQRATDARALLAGATVAQERARARLAEATALEQDAEVVAARQLLRRPPPQEVLIPDLADLRLEVVAVLDAQRPSCDSLGSERPPVLSCDPGPTPPPAPPPVDQLASVAVGPGERG